MKELLLISGSMKHFLGDYACAEKDFRKALVSPYSDKKLSDEVAKGWGDKEMEKLLRDHGATD